MAASGTVAGGAEEHAWLRQVGDEGRVLAVSDQSPNNVRVGTELDLAADLAAAKGPRISQIYLPLRIESRVAGVLVVGEKRDGTFFSAEDRRLLLAFSNQLAIAVERENFAEQQTRARALEESDRLKSALVSSVSHELKTPLAAIKISATTLLESAASPDAGVRLELADAINRETDRLTRLVSNLLDMSRLEAGALRPQLEWVAISDVVAEVLDRMEPILNGRQASVIMPEDVPATRMDFVQISQVLTNLLDNAVRYAPPGSGDIDLGGGGPRSTPSHRLQRGHAHSTSGPRAAVRQVLSPQHQLGRNRPRAVHRARHRRSASRPDLGRERRPARGGVLIYHPLSGPTGFCATVL